MTGDLEFMAKTTFQSCNITPEASDAAWRERGHQEGVVARVCAMFLNKSDEELAAGIRDSDDPEGSVQAMLETVDWLKDWLERHRAGIETLEITIARIMVVCSRVALEQEQDSAPLAPRQD